MTNNLRDKNFDVHCLINEILKDVPFTFGYLDDILVFSDNNEKHLEHLRTVFDTL